MTYVGLPEHLEEIDRRVLVAIERPILMAFEAQNFRVDEVVATVTIVSEQMAVVDFAERDTEPQAFVAAVSKINPKILQQSRTLLEQARREDHLGMLKVLIVAAASRRIVLCHLPIGKTAPS